MKGSLTGRSILVVEDEPLIAMAISQALEESGAEVTTTNTLRHALLLVEHDGLSAAILDHSLGDGNSSLLYARLRERGIPFVIYSGFERRVVSCKDAPHISKPASAEVLLAAMEDLILGTQIKLRQYPGIPPSGCSSIARQSAGPTRPVLFVIGHRLVRPFQNHCVCSRVANAIPWLGPTRAF